MAHPVGERLTSLEYSEAADIIQNTKDYNIDRFPAVKPKGGHMF